MRITTELLNDPKMIAVVPLHRFEPSALRSRRDLAQLRDEQRGQLDFGSVFRMLERDGHEQPLHGRELTIGAVGEGLMYERTRDRVGREHPRRAAKHVPGKLVEQKDQRVPVERRHAPAVECTFRVVGLRSFEIAQVPVADLAIEIRTTAIPTRKQVFVVIRVNVTIAVPEALNVVGPYRHPNSVLPHARTRHPWRPLGATAG